MRSSSVSCAGTFAASTPSYTFQTLSGIAHRIGCRASPPAATGHIYLVNQIGHICRITNWGWNRAMSSATTRRTGHTPTTTSPSSESFLRLPEVLSRIPVSKATWYAGIKTGRYPAQVKLGPRAAAWRCSDIDQLAASLTNNSAASPSQAQNSHRATTGSCNGIATGTRGAAA